MKIKILKDWIVFTRKRSVLFKSKYSDKKIIIGSIQSHNYKSALYLAREEFKKKGFKAGEIFVKKKLNLLRKKR